METIVRKNTLFRLRTDLLERLKQNAAKVNRTLNNYVESVLLDVVYDEPNDITKAAIAEAMSGRKQNKVYDHADDLLDEQYHSARQIGKSRGIVWSIIPR